MGRFGFSRSWQQVAFLAAAGAAAIHLAVAQPHFREWAPAGAFMLASGLAQLGWALWIVARPSPVAVVAGVGLNTGTAALWLVTRTAGLPIGPEAWMPEHIHAADALCTALELVAVVAALGVAGRTRPSHMLVGFTTLAAVLAAAAGAHDPSRERVTAAATLAIAFTVQALSTTLSQIGRRTDVSASLARRGAARVGRGRPGFGTHGAATHASS